MNALRFVPVKVCILLTACTPASAEPAVTGPAKAIDGDSLMVGHTEVRLHGIDAPEFNQTCTKNGAPWRCGEAAFNALSELVDGKPVRCVSLGLDQHERTLGRCTIGSTDVNRTMVADGYATAYRHYSFAYVSAEQAAKANKRGLWAGTFQLPSDYRHSLGEAPDRAYSSSGPKVVTPGDRPVRTKRTGGPKVVSSGVEGCVIKGNRGSHGWIYHMPGMPFYAKTRAEEMFCTEAEAQAAGYRRAKVR